MTVKVKHVSYCAIHDGVFEAGPEFGAEPNALQLKNIACHPEIPFGTITGATWTQLPSGLWVLSFDGNDVINCGSSAVLQPTVEMSIEVWANWAVLPAVGTSSTLVARGIESNNTNYWLYLSNTAGVYTLHFQISSGVARNSATVVWTPSVGTWYHLMGTFATGGLITLYRNAVSVDTTASGYAQLGSVDLPTYIGTYRAIAYWFNGLIALPRIYPKVGENHFQRERNWFGV